MKLHRLFCALILTALTSYAQADNSVKITDAWVRATSPGQEVGAAYMTLQSTSDTNLIKVKSTAAGSVEIHSMLMDKGVMKMRMLEALPLPAGKPIKLSPGGLHLMLFDLKQPLIAGKNVSFTLHFKDSTGKVNVASLIALVKAGNQ